MNPDLNKLIVKRHLYDSWGNLNTDSVFDNIKASFFFLKRIYCGYVREEEEEEEGEGEAEEE